MSCQAHTAGPSPFPARLSPPPPFGGATRPFPKPQKAAWTVFSLGAGEPQVMPETPPLARRSFTQNTAVSGSDLGEGMGVLREAAASKGRSQGHAQSPSRLPRRGPAQNCEQRRPRTREREAEGPPPRQREKRPRTRRGGAAALTRPAGFCAAAWSGGCRSARYVPGVCGALCQLPGSRDATALPSQERAPRRLRAS